MQISDDIATELQPVAPATADYRRKSIVNETEAGQSGTGYALQSCACLSLNQRNRFIRLLSGLLEPSFPLHEFAFEGQVIKQFDFSYATLSIRHKDNREPLVNHDVKEIELKVDAVDESGLAMIKQSIADTFYYLCSLHPDLISESQTKLIWTDNLSNTNAADLHEKQSVPPHFRKVLVTKVRSISPSFVEITLQGDNLSSFADKGYHIKLYFPQHKQGCFQNIDLPFTGADGRPVWRDINGIANDEPQMRVYTIKSIDVIRNEITIDMYLHPQEILPANDASFKNNAATLQATNQNFLNDKSPGHHFAANVMTGDKLLIAGPCGGIPPTAQTNYFLGDETSLPAIHRHLKTLHAGQNAIVFIELKNMEDIRDLYSSAKLDVHWLASGGKPGQALLTAFNEITPLLQDEQSTLFCACERQTAVAVRNRLKEQQLNGRRFQVAAYWCLEQH